MPHPLIADGPQLPEGCSDLWEHFLELHEARGGSMGPDKISFRDLADWQNFTGIRLAGWQVVAIRKADNAFLTSWAEQQPKAEQQ